VTSKRGIAAFGLKAISLAISLGCAPAVDGPIDHQRAIDRDDGDRLAAQLARLPGVAGASVVLHHARRDPLGATAPAPAMLAAVIQIDDRAEPEAIRGAAVRLARATLPELPAPELAIEIAVAVHRPTVARVGPFSVEESSRAALRASLALGCIAIAGLAAALALRARRHRLGSSAQ
jgi:hypothetical protein